MKIKIIKTVFGGFGMGEDYSGKTVFVENTLVGDIVKAKVYKDQKSLSFATVEEIIAQSPQRMKSPCPIFSECGGCSYLCTNYQNELIIKKEILIEQLTRIGHIREDQIPKIEIIHSDRFGYRSHSTIKTDRGRMGFFKRRSNEIVPFPGETCLLLAEKIREFIKRIPNLQHKGEIKIAQDHLGGVKHSLSKNNNLIVKEKNGGIEYHRGIWNFFQANMKLRNKMLSAVEDYCELNEDSNFIDIGAGCGFFTLLLARNSKGGMACEIDKSSVRSAVENAKRNNISNVKFLAIPFEKFRPGREAVHCIVADPPRAGLHKKSRQTINFIAPKKLVYVSCNPATFSRDAGDFIKGGYTLKALTMIDMFPGTHHIEMIGKFVIK